MNTFLIADTHFGHQGVCEFTNQYGNPLRPWDTWQEMDEVLVKNWNSVVAPNDKVYHLGDVTMKRIHLQTLSRLNGKKVLVRGNHDIFKIEDYLPYFYDVRGTHKLDSFLLSHVPIHPDSLGRYSHNIHGHLHSNRVQYKETDDPFYICVSVEQINYTPVELETLKKAANI